MKFSLREIMFAAAVGAFAMAGPGALGGAMRHARTPSASAAGTWTPTPAGRMSPARSASRDKAGFRTAKTSRSIPHCSHRRVASTSLTVATVAMSHGTPGPTNAVLRIARTAENSA